jgi:hypothetical protein
MDRSKCNPCNQTIITVSMITIKVIVNALFVVIKTGLYDFLNNPTYYKDFVRPPSTGTLIPLI